MTADRISRTEFTITLPAPFGALVVSYRNGRLTRVHLATETADAARESETKAPCSERDEALQSRLRDDFNAYFSGKKVTFDYPLDLDEFTSFQKAVWAAMRRIPYGHTRSYRWIAQSIGKPLSYRAVGNACGKNPLLIIQPCHRVVGSHGKLGGFSAGLELKKTLLRLEGVDFE